MLIGAINSPYIWVKVPNKQNSWQFFDELLNTKNIYFVPFGQDDYNKKPKSLVYDYNMITKSAELALDGKQIQPILI